MSERVLVCGGRGYTNVAAVDATLTAIHDRAGIALLIEGGARGCDSIARSWARGMEIPLQTVAANWKTHGKAAGPIRNAKMLTLEPTLVVAFPGGKGTADMVRRARAANIEVIEVTR